MKNGRFEELLKAFGTNVRKLRIQKGMTMEQLAEQSELDYTQIARIEHGKVNTSVGIAHLIAKGLQIPLNELFLFGHED